jgi:surface polysaccharide O-acyltransferase-like enzyme
MIKKERNSSIELLRIISMLFIVIYHIILHGQVLSNVTNKGISNFVTIIEFFVIIHVNLFVLITGYFQSEQKFKQSKLWALINENLFYKVAIVIFLTILGKISLSKIEIVKEFFVLNFTEYWFVKIYIYLYCLSPFINKMISNLTKSEYQKLLVVSFIIFSIIPYFTGGQAFENSGYTLYNFIYLYCIGAYLKKFPIEKTYIFKKFSNNLLRLIYIFIYFSCTILNYIVSVASQYLININSIFYEICNNILSMTTAYSNPIIIIQTISFFLIFTTFNFKSKIINKISKTTLGVYLIHDNDFVRVRIYRILKINNGPITSYSFILYILIISIFIFTVCSIIEMIRQLIFKFIYNRKISTKIRNNYYKWLDSLKLIK